MQEAIRELRRAGFESTTLEELVSAVERVRAETAAIAPTPPRGQAQALLAELLVLALETGPRQLKAYGELDEEAVTYLSDRSNQLGTLVQRLMDEYKARRRADAL
jgi:hypothetical protein